MKGESVAGVLGRRIVRVSVVLGVTAAALGAGSGSAFASRSISKRADVAATRRYLVALHQRGLNVAGDLAIGEADVKALLGQVDAECPNVLAGAPENPATSKIRNEVFTETTHLLEEPERPATIAFARRVESLRWSDRKLTYFARGSAEEAQANAELALPNICADAKAVAASGFQSVSPSTSQFIQQSEAANDKVSIVVKPPENPPGELDEKILKLLQPYERPDEKKLIPRRPSRRAIEKPPSPSSNWSSGRPAK